MKSSKNPSVSTKNHDFEFISLIFRIIIFLIARIGDGTIIIGKAILFVLKISFSICKKALIRFVYFLDYMLLKLLRLTKKIKPQPKLVYKKPFISLPTISLPKIYLPRIPLPRLHFSQLALGFIFGTSVSIIFIFMPYNFYLFVHQLPHPTLLTQRVIPVTTQIFDRNGTLLYEIYADENRKPLPFSEIPQTIKQATIAIEDKNFYQHPGFSAIAIARAARETIFRNHTQGGSTITQQLIKNALLTPEVSLERKIKEVILSVWAERIYSKNQILEMYLNQVPYGGTYWGVEAASWGYFGKSVKDLSLAESAYLAGLPAAPTLYSPYGIRPDLSRTRQAQVLTQMKQEGYITGDEEKTALEFPLEIRPQLINIQAPHFVMYIRDLLIQKYGARALEIGGLKITTTLDLPTQENVQQIVTNNILSLQNLKVGNGAAIVLNPQNGDILAMVGSKDYFDETKDGNVNVTLAPRQPGSSIKIVNYAAALEKGFTAASIIDDSPVAYAGNGSLPYAPVNYDGKYHGLVTLRQAFGNSYNIPAVKVLNQIGIDSMIDMGKKLGINTWEDKERFGLSLTLGGGEVTLLNLTSVYGVFANQGNRVNPDPILKIFDYTGRILYEKGISTNTSVVSKGISFIISDILADNNARAAAFGPNSQLTIPGKTVAVKTGTTNEKRDNWTLGYTPSIAVGVWVGNNDNSPMDPYLTSGITGAAPIWNQIMSQLLKNRPDEKFIQPADVISIPCYNRQEYFVKGTQPKDGCRQLPSPNPVHL